MDKSINKGPVVGSTYKHFKGYTVKIIAVGIIHTETQEPMVVYHHVDDDNFWIGSLNMFNEVVLHEGKLVPRFELISEK